MRQEDGEIPYYTLKTPKSRHRASRQEVSIELTRKAIHLLIAFVPAIQSFSKPLAIFLLVGGILVYIIFELLRMRGIKVPLISWITSRAARLRDDDHFVTGPITLGLGALLAVLLFSPLQAKIAIFILAFADGFSSLVGKTLGRIRLPLTQGKSLEGSITCFTLSFLSAYLVSGREGGSLVVALVATIVEAAPTKDWDNILLPLAAGATAAILGF